MSDESISGGKAATLKLKVHSNGVAGSLLTPHNSTT